MSKSPAFQWYAAEYLADEHVMLMTLEEEGAYIRLLSLCWREGSIPSDEQKLSVLCKNASSLVIRVVTNRFQPMPGNPERLVHKTLERERKKQAEWKQKSSEGGKKSAEKRWGLPRGKKPLDKHPYNGGSNGGITLQFASSTSKISKLDPFGPVEKNSQEQELPFKSQAFRGAWSLWESHRKSKKAKLTPQSIKLQFKFMAEIGEEKSIKAIHDSVRNGWTGIFENKEQKIQPKVEQMRMGIPEPI